MTPTLSISDQRMMELMDYQVAKKQPSTEAAFCESIGLIRQNLRNIRNGVQGFTKAHILKACEVYGVNANWIFGLEKKMFRGAEKEPLQLLKDAVAAIELELKPSAGKRKKAAANTVR